MGHCKVARSLGSGRSRVALTGRETEKVWRPSAAIISTVCRRGPIGLGCPLQLKGDYWAANGLLRGNRSTTGPANNRVAVYPNNHSGQIRRGGSGTSGTSGSPAKSNVDPPGRHVGSKPFREVVGRVYGGKPPKSRGCGSG